MLVELSMRLYSVPYQWTSKQPAECSVDLVFSVASGNILRPQICRPGRKEHPRSSARTESWRSCSLLVINGCFTSAYLCPLEFNRGFDSCVWIKLVESWRHPSLQPSQSPLIMLAHLLPCASCSNECDVTVQADLAGGVLMRVCDSTSGPSHTSVV